MTIFATAMATAIRPKSLYTVWVGGIEVTDNYVPLEIARRIAIHYKQEGYDDVAIERQHD